jgi:hypothetical protein
MVSIEVISLLPEGWGVCLSCEILMARANLDKAPHERGIEEYPPEWQEEFQKLTEFILDLSTRYGDSVYIRIFDPRSLQGLWKSIKYGIHRYPTFIIEKKKKVSGLDKDVLDNALQDYLDKA